MNVYDVGSSVLLTESPQSYSWASLNCLPRRLSIVIRTRTIKFKWDPFSRGIISYVSWGIRLHEGYCCVIERSTMIIMMIIIVMIIIMMITIIITIVLILIEMYRIEELLFKNKLVTDRRSKYLGYAYI